MDRVLLDNTIRQLSPGSPENPRHHPNTVDELIRQLEDWQVAQKLSSVVCSPRQSTPVSLLTAGGKRLSLALPCGQSVTRGSSVVYMWSVFLPEFADIYFSDISEFGAVDEEVLVLYRHTDAPLWAAVVSDNGLFLLAGCERSVWTSLPSLCLTSVTVVR